MLYRGFHRDDNFQRIDLKESRYAGYGALYVFQGILDAVTQNWACEASFRRTLRKPGWLTSLARRVRRLVDGRHLVEPGPTGPLSRHLQGRAIRRRGERVRDGFGRNELHERARGDLGRRSRGVGLCGAGGGVPASKRCVAAFRSVLLTPRGDLRKGQLVFLCAHFSSLTGTEEESEAVVEGTNMKLDLASVSSADKKDEGAE